MRERGEWGEEREDEVRQRERLGRGKTGEERGGGASERDRQTETDREVERGGGGGRDRQTGRQTDSQRDRG